MENGKEKKVGQEWRPCQKVKELYPETLRCERPASVRKMKARGSLTPICDECLPGLAIWPTDGPVEPLTPSLAPGGLQEATEAAVQAQTGIPETFFR